MQVQAQRHKRYQEEGQCTATDGNELSQLIMSQIVILILQCLKHFSPQSSIQLCPPQRRHSHEALADIMLLPYHNKSSGLLAHESGISVFWGTLVVDQSGSRGAEHHLSKV